MSWSFSLSVREIYDLAQFAGLSVGDLPEDEDEQDASLTVASCPEDGVLDDDGVAQHFEWIAYYSEYPEEGCMPLGRAETGGKEFKP